MEIIKGVYTGETDIEGNKIYYETTKLQLPDKTIAKLMFDRGQLSAYYARWEDGSCVSKLEGVNNHKSFYLRDCKILNIKNGNDKSE